VKEGLRSVSGADTTSRVLYARNAEYLAIAKEGKIDGTLVQKLTG
jgi:hypothetical protein